MKKRIRLRLLLYFSISMLVFALFIGVIFTSLFSRHNLDVHKASLEDQAERIAFALVTLPAGLEGVAGGHGNMQMGRGFAYYLQFLNILAPDDYWIISPDLEQVTLGLNLDEVSYKPLPEGAVELAKAALAGQNSFSESLGSLFGKPSITVATPLRTLDGKILGAVILNEQISDVQGATTNGLLILLFSIGVAIVLSAAVANLLAGRFTNPLRKMKLAAQRISAGDYLAKTEVSQADEIGELALALDDMAEQLHLASQASARLEQQRRDFIANISHELRTPVTVIRGSLEAISDGVVSEPARMAEYHEQMLVESVYLERMVNDLLDLARLQNPDFAIEMQKVDLREITADAVRSGERLARPKGVTLRLDVSGQDFAIQGDYSRLRQMLLIILDNAVKFSPSSAEVSIRLERLADQIRLSVRDHGSGISAEEMPYLFERFHKQRSEANKTGTGLGLSIAKQIADRHGITIEVASEPGQGSDFVFSLPIAG